MMMVMMMMSQKEDEELIKGEMMGKFLPSFFPLIGEL